MAESNVKKVPPDGGYGWVVTCAYALNNVVVLPLITSFGLIIQKAIAETVLTTSEGTLVIILNHSFGMFVSFFGGPVLKAFGYRKVAVVGAMFISLGLIFTSFATAYWMFIISYSIINSIGIATVMAAFNLAINSFFKEKRGRAVGLGMSITGLGAIYMPLLIGGLLTWYDWRNAVLLLGGICLHSLVAATLLRPAKWYLRNPPLPPAEELVPLKNGSAVDLAESAISNSKQNGLASLPVLDELERNTIHENHALPTKSMSMRSLSSSSSLETRNAVSHPDISKNTPAPPLTAARYKWWESQEINLGSSINIFHETDMNLNKSIGTKRNDEVRIKEVKEEKERKGPMKSLYAIVDFFDLTLLRDPIFVNILLGLSIASCVETNFSLLLPIILQDMMDFGIGECAKIMAVIGFSDTVFRLISPFIGEWCHKSPRAMYLTSLLMIVFVRTIILFTTSFKAMLFVAVAIGITKGVRTVYMNIVIPSYVPLERLPFASGIQMFVNGVITLSIGSLLGRLRDASGAYVVPIIVLNAVTLLAVLMWCIEFIYLRLRTKLSTTTDDQV